MSLLAKPRTVLCLALLLLAAACGPVYLDPGPNPARIKVAVDARVSKAHADAVVYASLGPMQPGFSDVLPLPVWDWGLYLVPAGADELTPLRHLPPANLKTNLDYVKGFSLKAETVFLAPPGKHRLRVMINGYKVHVYFEGGRRFTDYIYVGGGSRDFQLDLKPGQSLDLGVFAPPAK